MNAYKRRFFGILALSLGTVLAGVPAESTALASNSSGARGGTYSQSRGTATASSSASGDEDGYITLSPKRKIYYRVFPGRADHPTLLLVNGLIYDLDNWNDFIHNLTQDGYPVIQFAFSAQAESLQGLHLKQGEEPDFFRNGLSLEDLSDEILAVYNTFQKKGKVELMTLSYGSVATEFALRHRDKVDHLILTSPLVVPSEKYDPQGKLTDFWLNGWRQMAAWMDPFGLWSPMWYDYAYGVIWGGYLNERMDGRAKSDPNYYPPGIPAEVYKKSVFHMVRAARDFDLKDYAKRPLPVTHMLLASEESKPAIEDMLAVWDRITPSTRGSLAYFNPAYHALPGSNPQATYAWITTLLGEAKDKITPDSSYFIKVGGNMAYPTPLPELKKQIANDHR